MGLWRLILIYSGAFAALAFLVALLSTSYDTSIHSRNFPVFGLALIFSALGLWCGWRLKPQPRLIFEKNEDVMKSLGITRQEFRVLEYVTAGNSNKEIAREMGLSPNTVKSHMSRLFEKLDAKSRTQAIKIARQFELIP